MATVYLTFGQVVRRDVFDGMQVRSETVTSSGTSAQGALTANREDIVQIYCATAVYASANTTASQANGIYVAPNVSTWIAIPQGGKVAVIDAP